MSRESGSEKYKEDVADVMSSLVREIAESGRGSDIAQMVQNAKDLWLKGEHAAAYWILEAFKKGQEDALSSLSRVDKKGDVQSDVLKDVYRDDGLGKKFHDISFQMGQEIEKE
jgi:hypothetical protein